MIKEILATILFSFSTSTNSFKAQPRKANLEKIGGVYNIRNQIESTYLSNYEGVTTGDIYFDTSHDTEEIKFLDPVRINNQNYYLSSINLSYTALQSRIICTINVYDSTGTIDDPIQFTFSENTSIEILPSYLQNMYFYVRQSMLMNEDQSNLFNALFTTQENLYTKNYTGYYSFNNQVQTIDENIAMYGNITIGQNMFYTVTGIANSSNLVVSYYNPTDQIYNVKNLALPFSNNAESTQWYMQVKMTEEDYVNWENYGVFGYVPQIRPDTYSFEDLFFSLADTPIYFLYSIFNWQLFGANLFIALIGLISFALVLLLFRRFL